MVNADVSLASVARVYSLAQARPADTLGRLEFWVQALGDKPITAITPDEVDSALAALARRGRMQPVRNGQPKPTGKPLSPTTLTRYAGELGGVYRFARKHLLIPRSFTPPTKGLEVATSPIKSDYISAADRDRLIEVAQVVDRKWGRMCALIEVGFSSGWRAGNLRALRWRDVDLSEGLITAQTSKNGSALSTPISTRAVAALKALPGRQNPDGLVFGNQYGAPFHWRKLWGKVTTLAGLKGCNFHQLRHGAASTLAAAGASQAQLMSHMGHKTLAASRRYLHDDINSKRDLARKVFG